MENTALLVLMCFCFLGNAQEVENSSKNCHCPGSSSCSDASLVSVAQNLGALGEKVTNLVEKVTHLETKLRETETEVLELRSLTADKPKVAFSAALRESGSGNTGPFTTDTPLQFKRVFSNWDNNYNPATGIFTARVKGMYFFRFSMFNNLNAVPNSVVSLMKNDVRLTSVWDTSGSDANDMGSNAAVIALELGDQVYVQLMNNRVVYDDGMNYNTFSGFLLFPM